MSSAAAEPRSLDAFLSVEYEMQENESGFCPILQEQWSLSEATYSGGRVTLVLELSRSRDFPAPLGRPGSLVMAEPQVFEVEQGAEVTFRSVVWFQVTDELSDASAFPDRTATREFVGQYFRLHTKSELLDELRKVRVASEADRLKHYQLATGGEVVDIVSSEAPIAVLRGVPLK